MADQRERILEVTLGLMARSGARGTSMRAVAAATGCNVATLYHYYPSKHDLLQAAIAHRRVSDLGFSPFPEGVSGTVEQRLGALFDHLFVGMTRDEDLWRTLVAEAIHGEDDVLQPLLETAGAFEAALSVWLRDLCPEAPALHDPAIARTIRDAFIGVLVEQLPQPDGRRAALETRARDLAHVFALLSTSEYAPIKEEL